MVREGTANIEQRGDRALYAFGDCGQAWTPRSPLRGTELPVRSALRKCPNCGGQLEVAKS
jgi:hypothetical protein